GRHRDIGEAGKMNDDLNAVQPVHLEVENIASDQFRMWTDVWKAEHTLVHHPDIVAALDEHGDEHRPNESCPAGHKYFQAISLRYIPAAIASVPEWRLPPGCDFLAALEIEEGQSV